MAAIFLSASVPVPGRGRYYETADAFLIQVAVRELVTAVIRDFTLVWGGHPAITPMIWTICEDLGVEYANSVILYQSSYFENAFPEENERFANRVIVEAIPHNREASLLKLREQMLSRDDLHAAVFVGGMEGVEAEYDLFRHFHPERKIVAVGAPGGAARELAQRLAHHDAIYAVDFARLFRSSFRTHW
ncbi:MAG TPA: hypothetical protein VFJ16_00230 [Longimicrobium sp.]|nr:hypothetical protein [Longimicrobium sp.]